MSRIDRRTATSILLASQVAACAPQPGSDGRLRARPGTPAGQPETGSQPLKLHGRRDALLYVPSSYKPDLPAPLFVALHGAGGSERYGTRVHQAHAEALGVVLLSPSSRNSTWDGIGGRLGPDVEFLNTALTRTFELCRIEPARVAIGGFSDGASYALTLGLANGDLFTHILAFSPGFLAPPTVTGRPRIFISHGTHDEILPIDSCSRRLVPRLKEAGYEVDYREFNGPHTVPAEMAKTAFQQLLDAKPR